MDHGTNNADYHSVGVVLLLVAMPVALLAATLATLRGFGLLGPNMKVTDSGDLSADLALVGVMVTASVSVIGLILKRQSDQHLQVSKTDKARQLRLDAAMRAGSLFSSSESASPDPAAIASGLLALTQLDQASLAVALLVDLWSESDGFEPHGFGDAPSADSGDQMAPILGATGPPGRTVSTEVAVLVLDAALRSQVPSAQLVAAELLCRNAWRLDASKSLEWPSSIDGTWLPGLCNQTKLLLVEALIRMSCTSRPTENALRSLAVRLYGISSGDPCERVKGCIGTLLRALLPALASLGYEDFMGGSQTVTLSQLGAAASIKSETSDGMLERALAEDARHLGEWSSNASCLASPPTKSGAVPAAA
jgi:hypothetical protein